MITKSEINKQLQAVGRYMMDNELAWGNAGNISARTATDSFLITASGTYLGELTTEDLVECTLGQTLDDQTKKPSKEVPMHLAIYQERPEIQAVLHASPFYSTLAACANIDIPSDWFVESMYYLERVERIGYQHPGSELLGEAVREKAKQANILLLENHGVLVYDTSIKEARMALQTLEFTCRMMITARGASVDLRSIPQPVVDDFLQHSGYKPKRKWGE
ncbi:class II aldolase/adducin family protein [Gracilibacillus alcaliphilus]|uniref:class II aldolase/adducin family protein n=1 Tax=Gracilibacillus alcaliphilus TaxID=1401441 RepID=UPI00195D0573|nr:class II aldolase/adducin family protein [Gracilibacillus alcaliphilus]MBM7677559.1 L-fuculose-phosphate aldolase [Gracilibacillus alcaliphilus]